MTIFEPSRFVASLLVMVVHQGLVSGTETLPPQFATYALSWFFVFSGFILTYRYPQLPDGRAVRRFYVHRSARIIPVYFVSVLLGMLVLVTGARGYGLDFPTAQGLSPLLDFDLPSPLTEVFLIRVLLEHLSFTQLWDSYASAKYLLNPPLWSLAAEVGFYLCFPLLVKIFNPDLKPLTLLGVMVLVFLAGWWLISHLSQSLEGVNWVTINPILYTNPLLRLVEFLFGILTCRFWVAIGDSWYPAHGVRLLVLCLILTVYVAFILGSDTLPYAYSLFYAGIPITASVIFWLAITPWEPCGRLRRVLLLSGQLSYPIYGLHWPILALFNQLDEPNTLALDMLVYAIILVAALLIHLRYERHARERILARMEPPP